MIKKIPVVLIMLFCEWLTIAGQEVKFDRYFTDKACRIDFYLSGNSRSTSAFLDRIIQDPFWGGRRAHLQNDMNLGEYRFLVTDSATNQLIYADGFSSLYFEWQSTPEALLVNKSFEESVQFPYPKASVKFTIERRLGYNRWESLLSFAFSPDDKLIRRTLPMDIPYKTICKGADPAHAIDIAIVAEGYTRSQQKKFYKDAARLVDHLLQHEPFSKYKSRFNVYAIAAESVDTGVSMPQFSDWKRTALSSHFYTFYSARYLTSPDVFKLRDYAALVPYDALYILANTKMYGGGGIYNYYTLASADSKRAQAEVVVHEFGHSFAGLADEYFYDNDALNDMYDLKAEPWEPNITTLVNFDAKWKKDLPEGTAIPTPVTDETKTKIGVFEGGGYLSKGIYRPYYDCRMRTNAAKNFCPVCGKAVEKRIVFLTE